MKVTSMTKEQFDDIPCRKGFNSDVQPFYSLVIIPTGEMHESGFQMMTSLLLQKMKRR